MSSNQDDNPNFNNMGDWSFNGGLPTDASVDVTNQEWQHLIDTHFPLEPLGAEPVNNFNDFDMMAPEEFHTAPAEYQTPQMPYGTPQMAYSNLGPGYPVQETTNYPTQAHHGGDATHLNTYQYSQYVHHQNMTGIHAHNQHAIPDRGNRAMSYGQESFTQSTGLDNGHHTYPGGDQLNTSFQEGGQLVADASFIPAFQEAGYQVANSHFTPVAEATQPNTPMPEPMIPDTPSAAFEASPASTATIGRGDLDKPPRKLKVKQPHLFKPEHTTPNQKWMLEAMACNTLTYTGYIDGPQTAAQYIEVYDSLSEQTDRATSSPENDDAFPQTDTQYQARIHELFGAICDWSSHTLQWRAKMGHQRVKEHINDLKQERAAQGLGTNLSHLTDAQLAPSADKMPPISQQWMNVIHRPMSNIEIELLSSKILVTCFGRSNVKDVVG